MHKENAGLLNIDNNVLKICLAPASLREKARISQTCKFFQQFYQSELSKRKVIEYYEVIPNGLLDLEIFQRYEIDYPLLLSIIKRCRGYFTVNPLDYGNALHLVALLGIEPALNELLTLDPENEQEISSTVINLLALGNHSILLEKILEKYHPESNSDSEHINNLMFIAANAGSAEVVFLLIKRFNFPVDYAEIEDEVIFNSLLRWTLPEGHANLFWRLIDEMGADIHRDEGLMLAAAEANQWLVFEELGHRGLGAPPVSKYPQMLKYAACSNLALLKSYADEITDVDFASYNFEGENLYYAALSGGKTENVDYIIEKKWCNPNDILAHGMTALHVAAFKGHLRLIDHLIETYHLDITELNANGMSILHYVALHGNWHNCERLLEKYPVLQPMFKEKNTYRTTPIALALESGHLYFTQKGTINTPHFFKEGICDVTIRIAEVSQNPVLIRWVKDRVLAKIEFDKANQHDDEPGDDATYAW